MKERLNNKIISKQESLVNKLRSNHYIYYLIGKVE